MEDVAGYINPGKESDVTFLPSQAHIVSAPHGMPQAKVILRKLSDVLRWLGLRDPEDRKKIAYRTVCNENYQAIRVVGGS